MRARDHEHGDGAFDRLARLADRAPHDERERAGGDRDVEQDGGGAVGERLRPRTRRLRIRDEALDPREGRVVADGLDPDPDRAVGRHRAGHDAIARPVAGRPRLPRDHRLVERGVPVHDRPVRRHPPAGADQDQVARLELGDRDRVGHVAVDHLGLVRQERGERLERTRGLSERLHLLPVAEEHHVDQERELPPELEIQDAELGHEARDERHEDRQRDQEHHARLPIADLTEAAPQEGHAAVDEDDRPEDRGDPVGQREGRRGEAEPVLHHLRPDEHRDREQDAQPEAVAEHGDAVPGMLVVAPVPAGCPALRHGRRLVMFVMRVMLVIPWSCSSSSMTSTRTY